MFVNTVSQYNVALIYVGVATVQQPIVVGSVIRAHLPPPSGPSMESYSFKMELQTMRPTSGCGHHDSVHLYILQPLSVSPRG